MALTAAVNNAVIARLIKFVRRQWSNKELKTKLNEVETAQRAKAKATIAALESKIANLEEQLAAETA